jgi:hypothetical protein
LLLTAGVGAAMVGIPPAAHAQGGDCGQCVALWIQCEIDFGDQPNVDSFCNGVTYGCNYLNGCS